MSSRFHHTNPFANRESENPYMDGKPIDDPDNPFYIGPPPTKQENDNHEDLEPPKVVKKRVSFSNLLEVPSRSENNGQHETPKVVKKRHSFSNFLEVPGRSANNEQQEKSKVVEKRRSFSNFLEVPGMRKSKGQGDENDNPFVDPPPPSLEKRSSFHSLKSIASSFRSANNSRSDFLEVPGISVNDEQQEASRVVKKRRSFSDFLEARGLIANNGRDETSNNPFINPPPGLKKQSSFQSLKSKASSFFSRYTSGSKSPTNESAPPLSPASVNIGGESGDEADLSSFSSLDSEDVMLQQRWLQILEKRREQKKKRKRMYKVYWIHKLKRPGVLFQRRIKTKLPAEDENKNKKKEKYPKMYWPDGTPRYPFQLVKRDKPKKRAQPALTHPPLPFYLGEFNRNSTREELRYIAVNAKYKGGLTYKRFAWRLRIMRERIRKNFTAKYMQTPKKSKKERKALKKAALRRARLARRDPYDEWGYRKWPKKPFPASWSSSSGSFPDLSIFNSDEYGSDWEDLSNDGIDYEALFDSLLPWVREEVLDLAVYMGIEQKRKKYNPRNKKARHQARKQLKSLMVGPDTGKIITCDELGLALEDTRHIPPALTLEDPRHIAPGLAVVEESRPIAPGLPTSYEDLFVQEEDHEEEIDSDDISSDDSSICDSSEIDFQWKT